VLLRVVETGSFSAGARECELSQAAVAPALLADCPGLKIELGAADRLRDLIEGRLDLAMRVGEITDASLVARHLVHARVL
jgi:DNA-binding transcriptional LysR family regulator